MSITTTETTQKKSLGPIMAEIVAKSKASIIKEQEEEASKDIIFVRLQESLGAAPEASDKSLDFKNALAAAAATSGSCGFDFD
jgi:hypothetical protein